MERASNLIKIEKKPFYKSQGNEISVFRNAAENNLPVMIKGPTGCGKTRFVHLMAELLGRDVYTVSCHDDLSGEDLVGRYLIKNDQTVWQDGPLTRAVRHGGICYLDEIVEARKDTTVVIHPLADDRRILPVEGTGEIIEAHPDFMLVISYNPGYQNFIKGLKPSTRQRFVGLDFDYPKKDVEVEIVQREGGVSGDLADKLVEMAGKIRNAAEYDLDESVSTRLIVHCAKMISSGMAPQEAAEACLISPLTDDPDVYAGLIEVANIYLA